MSLAMSPFVFLTWMGTEVSTDCDNEVSHQERRGQALDTPRHPKVRPGTRPKAYEADSLLSFVDSGVHCVHAPDLDRAAIAASS